jgi:hypothetical protein
MNMDKKWMDGLWDGWMIGKNPSASLLANPFIQ